MALPRSPGRRPSSAQTRWHAPQRGCSGAQRLGECRVADPAIRDGLQPGMGAAAPGARAICRRRVRGGRSARPRSRHRHPRGYRVPARHPGRADAAATPMAGSTPTSPSPKLKGTRTRVQAQALICDYAPIWISRACVPCGQVSLPSSHIRHARWGSVLACSGRGRQGHARECLGDLCVAAACDMLIPQSCLRRGMSEASHELGQRRTGLGS